MEGGTVGRAVGTMRGETGLRDGNELNGVKLLTLDGNVVGSCAANDGRVVGATLLDGYAVGEILGNRLLIIDGSTEGTYENSTEDTSEGSTEGSNVGSLVGKVWLLGELVGAFERRGIWGGIVSVKPIGVSLEGSRVIGDIDNSIEGASVSAEEGVNEGFSEGKKLGNRVG